MGKTPRHFPEVVKEWKAAAAAGAMMGLSLRAVCQRLALEYGCHRTTVLRALNPDYAEGNRARVRSAGRKRYSRRKRKRQHTKHYHRFRRSLDTHLLRPAFDGGEQSQGLDDIVSLARATTGVKMRPKTIEGFLRRYSAAQQRGEKPAPPWLYEHPPESGTWYYTQSPPPGYSGKPEPDT